MLLDTWYQELNQTWRQSGRVLPHFNHLQSFTKWLIIILILISVKKLCL